MIYTVTIEDTITYRREVEIVVEAKSKQAAIAAALERVDEEMSRIDGSYTEEQIDNTPYEVIAVHT